jgi:hypothetical protein
MIVNVMLMIVDNIVNNSICYHTYDSRCYVSYHIKDSRCYVSYHINDSRCYRMLC